MHYAQVIKAAVIIFPLIAFLITMPFMIIEYRRYGSIPFSRSLVIYLFIFYLICVIFLVLLPFPDSDNYKNVLPNLKLFNYASEVAEELSAVSFNIKDPATWPALFKTHGWLEPAFNVLMLVPLGVVMHYYFRRSWPVTILLSFSFSLLIETTQLTGIWGIYPKAYRCFDVNDLLENTLGGLCGWLLAPLLTFFMPKREKIDETALHNGTIVSFTRRFVAFMIDASLLTVVVLLINRFGNIYELMFFATAVMSLIPLLFKGRTVGKLLVAVRLEESSASKFYILKLILRQFFIWGYVYSVVFFVFLEFAGSEPGKAGLVMQLIWPFVIVVILLDMLLSLRKTDKHLLYEEILGIENHSTIKVKEEVGEHD